MDGSAAGILLKDDEISRSVDKLKAYDQQTRTVRVRSPHLLVKRLTSVAFYQRKIYIQNKIPLKTYRYQSNGKSRIQPKILCTNMNTVVL